MQYKLYGNATKDTKNIVENVLKNRGIVDTHKYLNLDESVVVPYNNLDNIKKAVELFMHHYNNKNKIGILVDSDPDGYCSASMMYLYIKEMDNDYPVEYILHTRSKAHGLSDDVTVPADIKLLIIPDAGTNDVIECKELVERGIEILILDHHEKEDENLYATIVNNQMSDSYKNKDLCGAGIVYRFLQALDDENWNEYADNYLDLVAFANISDVMDMRSFETRYFTDIGLLNIKNKCLEALINAQDYSMCGKVNIHNIQWYITPILNGMIRIGSLEEKELLFRAFIEQEEYFEYKKRATKNKEAEVIQESIYDRAARLCKNAKSRQDKLREKGVNEIVSLVNSIPNDNKIVMEDVTNLLDSGLTGVVAIKISELFNKPCILLKKHYNEKLKKMVYGGSARNLDNSPIDSFKDVINSSNVIKGKGHANAFGIVDLDINDKDKALDIINDSLNDIEYDSTYRVDYILDIEKVNIPLIMELSKFDDIVGQGIDDPIIAVENIILQRGNIEIFGKNEDTVSFEIDGIKYILFKCKSGNPLYDWLQNAWNDEDRITINVVGKPSINEYNGVRTPQIILEDVLLTNSDCDEDEDW
ncbi:DHH family phosphoesterase [Lachnospiraceae bacterium 54-53]